MFSSHNLTGTLISDVKKTKKGYRAIGPCKTWNRWALACTEHVSKTGNDGKSIMRDHGTFTSYRFEFETGPHFLICCKSTPEKEIDPDIIFEITSCHIKGGFRIKLTPNIPYNQEYDLYCISEDFFQEAQSEQESESETKSESESETKSESESETKSESGTKSEEALEISI